MVAAGLLALGCASMAPPVPRAQPVEQAPTKVSASPTAVEPVADPWESSTSPAEPEPAKRFAPSFAALARRPDARGCGPDPNAAARAQAIEWVGAHCELGQAPSYVEQPVCRDVCPPARRIFPCPEYRCRWKVDEQWLTWANQNACMFARGTTAHAKLIGCPE